MSAKEKNTTNQPKSLLWANARLLLVIAFVLGLGLGVWVGYFGAINITNDLRKNFVAEQNAVAEVAKKAVK